MTGFRYGVPNRPIGHATVPQGYTRVETAEGDEAQSLARHGVTVYDQPLSPQLVAAFELVPFLDAPAIEGLAAAIAGELAEYRAEYLAMVGEDPQAFRVTVFDALRRAYPGGVHVGRKEDFLAHVVKLLGQMPEQKAA